MTDAELARIANEIRKGIIVGTHAAKSGHPGGSLSAADILTYLYFEEMSVDPADPRRADRDRLVLSKGHAAPALYAALESALHDALNDDEDVPLLCQEGDMARISMEGSYFPEDEVVEAFHAHLTPDMQGKLDVLDMDGWRLTRHVFTGGQVKSSSAPLNNVLDYSGH